MFRDEVLHIVAEVNVALVAECALHLAGEFHIVITVHAENVFHHVAWALHIHAVGWHHNVDFLCVFAHDFHFEAFNDALDSVVVDVLADKAGHIVELQFHRETREFAALHIDDVATNLTTCEFLDEDSGEFEVVNGVVGVDATLEAERCVGVQAEAACALTHPGGVEVGTFEEHVGSGVGHARIQAAKHTADAHRLFSVANHEVAVGECAFHTVESGELSAWGNGFHHHLIAFHLAEVETVHRLTCAKENVVGDVHNIVDGALAYSQEVILQPLRTFLHLHATNGEAAVARASLGVFHFHRNGTVGAVALESVNAWAVELGVVAVTLHPSVEVASHTVVRSTVHTVRGEVHLNQPVALHTVVVGGRSAHFRVGRKHDDAIVACAHAYFVFSANHTARLHAAKF